VFPKHSFKKINQTLDFFLEFDHIEVNIKPLFIGSVWPAEFCCDGNTAMLSNLLLLATTAADPSLGGAALFAALCGLVLMGGRTVIGFPVRILNYLRPREVDEQPVVSLRMVRPEPAVKTPDVALRRAA
jgi:hypothetical protein